VEDLLLLLVEDVLLLRVLQEALVLLGGVDLLELLALLRGHETPVPKYQSGIRNLNHLGFPETNFHEQAFILKSRCTENVVFKLTMRITKHTV